MKRFFVMLSVLLSTHLVSSQSEKPITLEEVLQRVNENNANLKMSEQDVLMAKGDYKQTNAVFLPQLEVSHTALATTNPLMAFGVKLNQEILTANDFNPDLLNAPSQIEDYATRVEIKQPLLNIDGVFQRKAAKAKLNAMSFQAEHIKDYIYLEAKKAYMQLQLAYKTLEVLEKTQEATLANKQLAENSFEQGFLQQADMLAVEVRVTEVENQLLYAKSNIKNASNYVSVLMNTSDYEILKPIDNLEEEASFSTESKLSNTRSDILAFEKTTEAYKQLYKADKMAFLPTLDAFATYELHDDQIFQGNAKGYLFGAQLSWKLFDGSKRLGKAQKSKAALEKSKLHLEQYKAKSQVELNTVYRMLEDSKNNLKLTRLALEQSKESLRIRKNRFREGLEKTSDLLLAESQYAQKQLDYYNTIYKHNYALEYLKVLIKK